MSKRIAFRNFLDTVISFIKNEATTPREWTFQDRDGTILDDTDYDNLGTAIDEKADAADTATALGLKANTSDVNTALGLKADAAATTSALAAKADAAATTAALALKAPVMTMAADATDADFSMAVNSVKYLPASTLSQNRTITLPAGTDGDVMEFYNNEIVWAWLISGNLYYSDGITTVTQLQANTNYIIRKVSSKWRICN